MRPPASLTWTRSRISPARSAQRARAGRKQREADIAKLAELRDRLRAAKDAYWAEQVEIGRWQPQPAASRRAQARRGVEHHEPGRAEDKTESPSSRPDLLRPRELYGAMLLERGMLHDALAAFEATLVKEPNRYNAFSERCDRPPSASATRQKPALFRASWPRWRAAPRKLTQQQPQSRPA